MSDISVPIASQGDPLAMGRDRPWNAKFPEHLRRSRSRKPKWQKKLKSKERDLLQAQGPGGAIK